MNQASWTHAFVRLLETGYTIEQAVAELEGTLLPFGLDSRLRSGYKCHRTITGRLPDIDLDQIEARANHEAWWDK